MFAIKRREKWKLRQESFDRIPTRWKMVIAGLLGSGVAVFFLTIWCPDSRQEMIAASWSNETLTESISTKITNVQPKIIEKTTDYCTFRSCSSVTCLAIPVSLDPGQVASDYINKVLKIQCPTMNSIEQLTFDTCFFPKNKLVSNWLKTDYPIETLTLRNSGLAQLSKGSFGSNIFANTKTLEIETANIRVWKKSLFRELSNLKRLQIVDNAIREAEYDLLEPVADSLEILVLDGSLQSFEVLSNITNGSSILSKVLIASIQRNSIKTLDGNILKKVPNIVSLYLSKSEIEKIDKNAFASTRYLVQLDLKNNLLKNLPNGIFPSALLKNPNFKVWMTENPWNCSCDFKWIIEIMSDYPTVINEIPKCESPEKNALLLFTQANFCQFSTTLGIETSGKTTKILTKSTTEINRVTSNEEEEEEQEEASNFLKFVCKTSEYSEIQKSVSRKLLSTDEFQFPSRFRDFFARILDDKTILVNIRTISIGVSLIWFKNDNIDPSIFNPTINCVKNIKGPFVIENLERDSSYTICLLEEIGKAPSPFNCLAIRTSSSLETEVWLKNEDKTIVFSVFIAVIILICLGSSILCYIVIRRNPSLLRGSKRVVLVRKRSVKALILPEGIRMDRRGDTMVDDKFKKSDFMEFSKNLKKDTESDYLTPLNNIKPMESPARRLFRCDNSNSPDPPRRKDSKASRVSSQYSAGSYVSGIEPSPMELANWRNNYNGRTTSSICFVENDELEEPPPLPPHHPVLRTGNSLIIPSLSLSIDSNRNYEIESSSSL